MKPVNPFEVDFSVVELFDCVCIFTSSRIQRDEVPSGLFVYDLRHADDGSDKIVEITKNPVLVNHWGTIISKQPLQEKYIENFNDEYDMNFLGNETTLQNFIDRFNDDMTLWSAIMHAKEVYKGIGKYKDMCEECRNEHNQLANWLIELWACRHQDYMLEAIDDDDFNVKGVIKETQQKFSDYVENYVK